MSKQNEVDKIKDIINIEIMGREFPIKCPRDELTALRKASLYLDTKMKELSSIDKFVTIDRLSIVAALNIAHELISSKEKLLNIKDKLTQKLLDGLNAIKVKK